MPSRFPSHELSDRWRDEADVLERRHSSDKAAALRDVAAELVKRVRRAQFRDSNDWLVRELEPIP